MVAAEDAAAHGIAVLEETFPDNYYFKGFLAWCLRGYIPIDDSAGKGMKSNLLSDSKSTTSFGRNTASRSALKNKAACVATNDGLLPIIDERRGKQRRSIDATRRTSSTSSFSGGDTGNDVVLADVLVVANDPTASITAHASHRRLLSLIPNQWRNNCRRRIYSKQRLL